MRGIIEIIVAVSIVLGGGQWVLKEVLYQMKQAAAEKIQEQGSASLGDYTRKMTGSDTGL